MAFLMEKEIAPSVAAARVVLLCGISGSGKTVYARRLGEYGFRRISSDAMAWARYGGDFTAQPWEVQKALFADVNGDIDRELDAALCVGEKVVVDSTLCKRCRRDRLRAICRSRGVEPVLVYLPATYQTLQSRLSGRCGTGPDDIIISDSQLRGFCGGFEPPALDEPAVVV